jgi:hypothetical protein
MGYLPMFDDGLIPTTHFDWEMSELADRHYSRRTPGARQFLYAGRKLVLRNATGTVLFGWIFPLPDKRFDDQTGFYCAIFRNESSRLASQIILEAEAWAEWKWGKNRFFTYVDPTQVKGNPPGNCFLRAGWRFERLSQGGKHLLVKGSTSSIRSGN